MRFSLLSLIFSLIITSSFAQRGDNYMKLSHNITTEAKNITGFDKIEVSEDFEVYIRIAETEKVEIEANENLHDLIQVEKRGQTLKISTKSYSTSYNNWNRKSGAKERLVAYISAKNLSAIRGDEDVTFVLEDKLTTKNLTIDLDEDTTFEGWLEVQNLSVYLDEDSILDIEGSTQAMEVQANEDSIIQGFDFVVDNLAIELNEDSVAKLTVNGDISLRAREDSCFSYRGDGSFVSKRLTGDSQVKHW